MNQKALNNNKIKSNNNKSRKLGWMNYKKEQKLVAQEINKS